jgi:hypothetical protein
MEPAVRRATASGGQDGREIVPPAALGFEQILDGSAMRETMRTSEPTVCLALGRGEILRLLSENTELVQGLFRMLAADARGG